MTKQNISEEEKELNLLPANERIKEKKELTKNPKMEPALTVTMHQPETEKKSASKFFLRIFSILLSSSRKRRSNKTKY